MNNSFKKNLIKNVKKKFRYQAILVSLVQFVLLLFLVFFIQNYQLNSETNKIASDFNNLTSAAFKSLKEINDTALSSYPTTDNNEKYLYQKVFEKISIFGDNGSFFIIDSNGNVVFNVKDAKINIKSLFLKIILDSHKNQDSFMKNIQLNNKEQFILFFKRIDNYSNYSVLMIDKKTFSPLGLQYGTQFIIADKFNNIYAKNTKKFIVGRYEKIESQMLEKPFLFDNRKLYLIKNTRLNSNLYLYTFSLSFPLKILIIFSLLSVILVMLILFLNADYLSKIIGKKTNQEIEQLVDATSKIRYGKQSRIILEISNEFKFLVDSINLMMDELEHNQSKQIYLEKQKSLFERKMLEAQFNPHFLYNTLENIRIMIQLDPPVADKLILSLNVILRYSIDNSIDHATIFEDLKIIESFLKVNAIRFEKFKYNIQIDEKVKKFIIPKLILLPLIENSLKYGMKMKNDLTVNVICKMENDNVVLSVCDDGPGFTEEDIIDIYQKKAEGNHGLNNSWRRFILMYPNTILTIESLNSIQKVSFVIKEGAKFV